LREEKAATERPPGTTLDVYFSRAHAARLGLPGFGVVVPLDAAESAEAFRVLRTRDPIPLPQRLASSEAKRVERIGSDTGAVLGPRMPSA
jgi:hypothetical protein